MELGNPSLPSRFWAKVETSTSGCWLWTGAIHKTGYGLIKWEGRARTAHAVAYEAAVGEVSDGLQLDHTCHDPNQCVGGWGCLHRRCVNPEHLEPVTALENQMRGRNGRGVDRERERQRKQRWANQRVVCPDCDKPGTMHHRARHRTICPGRTQ